ncbi:cell division control protein 2 homolog 3-like [Micropterus salmoides]|uniref:cell division control protein 2 homolog 3-like n=1 Tax=Micropterus salmoides TaxID=27706 RepID=UPI0018EA95CB|nr:cell division control protein 2 homolog 3-like [Micropterus salmoides]XP_038553199.1 cell division control protein 2 homolog 3-like [Micropterus salmoides]
MENYLKSSILGRGSYGTVYKVLSRTSEQIFALKCTGVPDSNKGVEDSTVRELSCLTALKGHPNVIQIHDCFIDNGQVAMVMDYVPYTLAQIIHNGHGVKFYYDEFQCTPLIPESFIAHFSTQVANALSYMHGLNIIHRDLTPSNILVTEDLVIQVADMGMSRHASRWMSPAVVTEPYRAPEVCKALAEKKECTEYTCAIDMWSLGVMIADAFEGHMVFQARKRDMTTYDLILRSVEHENTDRISMDQRIDLKDIIPNVMSSSLARNIVMSILVFRETERLTAREFLRKTEWTQLASMTEDDIQLVKKQIARSVKWREEAQEERDAERDLKCHETFEDSD